MDRRNTNRQNDQARNTIELILLFKRTKVIDSVTMLVPTVCDRRLLVMLSLLCVCIVVITLERITVSFRTAAPAASSTGGESADNSSNHLENALVPQIVHNATNIPNSSKDTYSQHTIVKECTQVLQDITSGLLEWNPAPDK